MSVHEGWPFMWKIIERVMMSFMHPIRVAQKNSNKSSKTQTA